MSDDFRKKILEYTPFHNVSVVPECIFIDVRLQIIYMVMCSSEPCVPEVCVIVHHNASTMMNAAQYFGSEVLFFTYSWAALKASRFESPELSFLKNSTIRSCVA